MRPRTKKQFEEIRNKSRQNIEKIALELFHKKYITPLIRGSIFTIINLNDHSFVLVPSISYSVITNLDLYLIGLFFNGDDLTEYGSFGHYFYARLKWSF